MRGHVRAVSVIATMVFPAWTAVAHHSNSSYQVDEIISLTGTVKEWQWVNPHTWLIMAVEDENGNEVEWAVEGRAPGILRRAGWNATTFQVGETVQMAYQAIGYRRIKNPRIWSLHDLALLSRERG